MQYWRGYLSLALSKWNIEEIVNKQVKWDDLIRTLTKKGMEWNEEGKNEKGGS